MTGLNEAQVRAIVRDEVGTALSVTLLGDADLIADYNAGLLTADEVTQRIDLLFKGHQSAEHAGDALVQSDHAELATDGVSFDAVDDRLRDRQAVGDLGIEGNEFHGSPSAARAATRYGTDAETPCRDGGCSVGEEPDTNTAVPSPRPVPGTRESGPVEAPEAPGPDSPPSPSRYDRMAITVDALLPPHCKGLRFETIAGVLEAADKASLLTPAIGGELAAFQRYTKVIAALLGADFTAPRLMDWDERQAVVTAVLNAVSAFYEAHLDGRIS